MLKVASFVRLMAGLAYMAVAGGLFFAICLVLLPSRRLRIAATNHFGHVTGRFCLWVTGTTVNKDAIAKMRAHHPAIYVSNHTSITDIWIAIMCAPTFTCGMAKKEIVYYPFFGQLYWISGHLRVDRSNRYAAMKALKETATLVNEHKLGMFIWAEGTRSKDGRLLDLQKGFAHLAMATKLPIVPVVVKGAHKGWQKNQMLFQRSNVEVEVLPAIITTDWTSDTLDERLANLHAAMNAALPEDQRGPPMKVTRRAAKSMAARAAAAAASEAAPPETAAPVAVASPA